MKKTDKNTMPVSTMSAIMLYLLFSIGMISAMKIFAKALPVIIGMTVLIALFIINIFGILLRKKWGRIMGIIIMSLLILLLLSIMSWVIIKAGFRIQMLFIIIMLIATAVLLYFFGFSKKSVEYYKGRL